MTRRLLLPAVLALALAAATGHISHSSELGGPADARVVRAVPLALVRPVAPPVAAAPAAAVDEEGAAADEPADEPAVEHLLDVQVTPEAVHFALRLTNTTDKRLEVAFPDGYTHDVTVFDAAGREVWRWSRGRLFTQAMRTRMLAGNESFELREAWHPDGQRGTFTAVVQLRSSNFPVAERTGFQLR